MNTQYDIPDEGGRVDVHHHMVPSFYLEALDLAGVDATVFPSWTPEKSLKMMEGLGITKAILSISSPGVWFGQDGEARQLARRCNEYAAELCKRYPARFGALAILPFPDLEGALEELSYGLDTLRLHGVLLLTNVGGKYVGDPEFDALMTEINRRKARVFLHPNHVPSEDENASLYGWAEYPLDVARAYLRMVYNDVLVRYSDIDWTLAHAGGAVPFLAERLGKAHYAKEGGLRWGRIIRDLTAKRNRGLELAKKMSYETAESADPITLAALRRLVGPEQILFGSNFPWGAEVPG
ncbi:MAG: amidohydrolase family protein [Gemmatimonadetes bacterium]|nr:amidohydrolase [Gemmatimonadota bacterium]NNM07358.1 amidohydrolase family protein [Gemmatimonadota bacterium]